MNTLRTYWTRFSRWWDGCTPTGKCLVAVAGMLVAILLLAVVL